MPKYTAISVPTSTQNQIKLDNPWPVDVDILIQILEWFRREDLAIFQLLCRFNNALISVYRDRLKRGLAPLDCVTIINETRSRILPGTSPISVTDLSEHWPHNRNTFRRLCSVRSLSYFFAPRSAESEKFVKEIACLTYAAMNQPEYGFLKNPYLRDLVYLTIFIEAYHRSNDEFVLKDKHNNKEYKLSDIAALLYIFINSNNQLNASQTNHDTASICLYLFILCTENKDILIAARLFASLASKLNFKSMYFRQDYVLEILQKSNTHYSYTQAYTYQQFINSVLLPYFINPLKLSRILPNTGDWQTVTPAYVQTLCNFPQKRSYQLLKLNYHVTAEIINVSYDLALKYFNQIDALSNKTESDLYLSSLNFLKRYTASISHRDLQQILCIPPTQLQAIINNILKKLIHTKLYYQSHIIFLILIFRYEANFTVEFFVNLFNTSCITLDKSASFEDTDHLAHCNYLETAITFMLKLDIRAISYLINNQHDKDLLYMFANKSDKQLISIFKIINNLPTSALILYLLAKRFINLKQLNMMDLRFELFKIIINIIPQEQFTKENTNMIIDSLKSKNQGKTSFSKASKAYLINFEAFFEALSTGATPLIQDVIKVLTSPIFDKIIASQLYTTLFKMIGTEKLEYFDKLRCHDGIEFITFLETIPKFAPAKFSGVLQIIKETCAASQEQDVPRRITKFLNTPVNLTPSNASTLLITHGTFSARKRLNDDQSNAQEKHQKLTPPPPPRKP